MIHGDDSNERHQLAGVHRQKSHKFVLAWFLIDDSARIEREGNHAARVEPGASTIVPCCSTIVTRKATTSIPAATISFAIFCLLFIEKSEKSAEDAKVFLGMRAKNRSKAGISTKAGS